MPEAVEYRISYPFNSVGALVDAVHDRSTAPAVVDDEVAVTTGVFCVTAKAGSETINRDAAATSIPVIIRPQRASALFNT